MHLGCRALVEMLSIERYYTEIKMIDADSSTCLFITNWKAHVPAGYRKMIECNTIDIVLRTLRFGWPVFDQRERSVLKHSEAL
jgi:hypothetical protein